MQLAFELRTLLWDSATLLDEFIAQNPAHLSEGDLAIAASWRQRVKGPFFIFRHLKKYSVFLTEGRPPKAFGVLGLVSSLEDTVPWPLPIYVDTVLLPFDKHIIYDSLLTPYNVSFGSGIRRSLNDAYREAQERGGVISTLDPANPAATKAAIEKGNEKILNAFQKSLAASGLSLKMIAEHSDVIARFNEDYLLNLRPPCSLLDITVRHLRDYLDNTDSSANLVSFKRFVRFLEQTGRMDWDSAEGMKRFLKQR